MDSKKSRRKGYNSRIAGRMKKRTSNLPNVVEIKTDHASMSARKLSGTRSLGAAVNPAFVYCILDFVSVFTAISENVVCKDCHGKVKFFQNDKRGAGFKLIIQCDNCEEKKVSSCPLVERAYEVNRRLIFVFSLIGVGLEGLNKFLGLMDFCAGIANNTYYATLQNINTAASAVYEVVLRMAVDEEKELNASRGNKPEHLTVSGDGSWKKRGFSSRFGVATLIGNFSGKVVDSVVKSSFCQLCASRKSLQEENIKEFKEWYETHEKECTINHTGSAGKMEVDAITEMFARSISKHGVKYVKYIGDGDSKTFKGILDSNIYGNEVILQKMECVGHVEKRMGTRLRKLKNDNKGIGGKGRGKLTDKLIGELTKFYGLAIRRNLNSVHDMKNAILASLEHCASSDEQPQHSKCPPGENSWCKWRRAEAQGTFTSFEHDRIPIDPKIVTLMIPIYDSLSSDNLLERCLGAHTQNSNESLNSCIWILAPKHLHSGKQVVEIATYLAVMIFNEGFS